MLLDASFLTNGLVYPWSPMAMPIDQAVVGVIALVS
jgi:hypothetical protein